MRPHKLGQRKRLGYRMTRRPGLTLLSAGLLISCAAASSLSLAAISNANVTATTYVTPRNGLIVSGHFKHTKVTLYVTHGSYGVQRVSIRLSCFGHTVAFSRGLPVTYSSSALVRDAQFSTSPKFSAFTASGFFRTSTTAHVGIHVRSFAAKRACTPQAGAGHGPRFSFVVKHITKRGNPAPAPPGQYPAVELTQCPSPERSQVLQPGANFTVKGLVFGGKKGEIAIVTYTTLQGGTGKQNHFTSFSYVQPDGTFTANYTVPVKPGITAGAGVDAQVFPNQHTDCFFYDR